MTNEILAFVLLLSSVVIMAKSKPFALKGDQLDEDIISFTNKHLDADCYKETDSTQVCEQNRVLIYNKSAWVRSEFTREHLTYLSFSINGEQNDAEKIFALMKKDFGDPDESNAVIGIVDSLTIWYNKNDNWYDKNDKLCLTYSSADTNHLGHGVIRIWLEKREISSSWSNRN
jgi:hypothetical protein